jgi:triphosphoribosyl-dephospho-CoA synthase
MNAVVAARAQVMSRADAIAASAVECLLMELETWPKPGLVSHVDSGSHDDMDANTFRTSAVTLEPYHQPPASGRAVRAARGAPSCAGFS